MSFDYSAYLEDNVLAAFTLVGAILGLTIGLMSRIIPIINNRNRRQNIFDFFSILILSIFLFSIGLSRLMHGGAVFFEKESDKIQMQGQIEKTEELGNWGIPELPFDGGRGTQLTINGVKVKTLFDVSFHVGDYVHVEYLPQSGYVLYICEIPDK